MINRQHETALSEGQRYAKQHGHSLAEEVSYGRGFKAGSNWYRNNIWHDIKEKADSSEFIIFYDGKQYMSPPSRCPLSFETFVDAMNRKYGATYTMWAYMSDILPDIPEDLDDVDPNHLVHQHEDDSHEENKFNIKL